MHAKDCDVSNQQPTWGEIGTMSVGWEGQLKALVEDGYRGAVSLETHWSGPGGDKFEGSRICGARLREMLRGSLGSDRGQTGVRPGSDRGQTGVRPGSDPR